MIVVLEGPDGSGKTTLARALQEKYGLDYRHEGPPPPEEDVLRRYMKILYDAMMLNVVSRGIVLDRFALGERVYGPVVRGSDALGPEGWDLMQGYLRHAGAKQVLCLPSYESCRAAWSSGREEMFKDESVLRQTYDSYVKFKKGMHVFNYDRASCMEKLAEFLESD